jgi:hypothetical protein
VSEAATADLQQIATTLADQIDRPVDIDDAHLRLLAHSPHHADVDAVRLRSILQRHPPREVVGHLHGLGVADLHEPTWIAASDELAMAARLCVPIRRGRRMLGFVWLLDDGRIDERTVSLTVTAAATAAEVLDHARLHADDTRQRMRDQVQRALGPDSDRAELAMALLIAGGAMSATQQLAIVALRGRFAGEEPDLVELDGDVRRSTMPREAALAVVDGHVAILVSSERRDLAGSLADALVGPRSTLVAGVASDSAHSCAHATWRHACFAAEVAAAAESEERVVRWECLGARRYLAGAASRVGAFATLEPEIARATETAAGRALLLTVETYLDLAGDTRAAAELLHLHRSSLYHRLGRAQALLGIDLRDGIARLDVHLGLKAARQAGLLPGQLTVREDVPSVRA